MASPVSYNAHFQQTRSLAPETQQFNNSLMKIAKPTSIYLDDKLLTAQKKFKFERDENTGKMLEAIVSGDVVPKFDNYDHDRFAKASITLEGLRANTDLNIQRAKSLEKTVGYLDDNQDMRRETHQLNSAIGANTIDMNNRRMSLNEANVGSQIEDRAINTQLRSLDTDSQRKYRDANTDLSNTKLQMALEGRALDLKNLKEEENANTEVMEIKQAVGTTITPKYSSKTISKIVDGNLTKELATIDSDKANSLKELENTYKANSIVKTKENVAIGKQIAHSKDPKEIELLTAKIQENGMYLKQLNSDYTANQKSIGADTLDKVNNAKKVAVDYRKELSTTKVNKPTTDKEKLAKMYDELMKVDDEKTFNKLFTEYEKLSDKALAKNKAELDAITATANLELKNEEQKTKSKEQRVQNNRIASSNSIALNVAVSKVFNIDRSDDIQLANVSATVSNKLLKLNIKPPYTQKVIEDSFAKYGIDKDTLLDEVNSNE